MKVEIEIDILHQTHLTKNISIIPVTMISPQKGIPSHESYEYRIHERSFQTEFTECLPNGF
jgi:hypothetical protein